MDASLIIPIEHNQRQCIYYISEYEFNLGSGEGYESDLQIMIEAFSRKKDVLFLCHIYAQGKLSVTWQIPQDIIQTCALMKINIKQYFRKLYKLLPYYELALNGFPVAGQLVKSTADIIYHKSMIRRIPNSNLLDSDDQIVFRNTQIRDLCDGDCLSGDDSKFEVGLLQILAQQLAPTNIKSKQSFDQAELTVPGIYKRCCKIYEDLRLSFNDSTFDECVKNGTRVISCKTKMLYVEIASIEYLKPQIAKNAYIASIIYMLRLVLKIQSLTVAGPINGFDLGFRYEDSNIQGTNGVFLPFDLFATRSVNALQQLIQDDSIIINIDGSDIEDEETRQYYMVILCGLFVRDTDEILRLDIPQFKIQHPTKNNISFTSTILKQRPPLLYQLLNDQYIPLIEPLSADHTLQNYITDIFDERAPKLVQWRNIYRNGRTIPDFQFNWMKHTQYYLHSGLNILEAAPLYNDLKHDKPHTEFLLKLNEQISKNQSTPRCVGLRRLIDNEFWTQYHAQYTPNADGQIKYEHNPRDTIYLNQYLLAKSELVNSTSIIDTLHQIYPGVNHFAQLGRGAGKHYSMDHVIQALKAAIKDHSFPPRI